METLRCAIFSWTSRTMSLVLSTGNMLDDILNTGSMRRLCAPLFGGTGRFGWTRRRRRGGISEESMLLGNVCSESRAGYFPEGAEERLRRVHGC
jgi:hypothetical protein